MSPDEYRSEGTPSLSEGPDARGEPFFAYFFLAFEKKVSRRKGETASRRYRRNGYVLNQPEPGRPKGRHVQPAIGKGLDMNSLIRDRNHRSAGSLSCTPLQAIDNCAASIGNGGSSARKPHPSTNAHAA